MHIFFSILFVSWILHFLSRSQVAPAATSSSKKKGMTSWADSDTESDVENAAPPERKLDAFGESESESDSESASESEDEDEVRSRDRSACMGLCLFFRRMPMANKLVISSLRPYSLFSRC